MPTPLAEATALLRRKHEIPEPAFRRLQAILAAQNMSPAARLGRLDELAGWLAATIAQLTRPGNDAPELRRLKSEAAAALGNGELERAMDLLKEVRHKLRDDRRRTEARLVEEVQTLKQQMLEEALAAARLGELALARGEYVTAAELLAEAASSVPTTEPVLELAYRLQAAEALASLAEVTGETGALAAAATAYRAALPLAGREGQPAEWARINVGLGDMQAELGRRDGTSTTNLELAAAAYDAALDVIDEQTHAMRWALVQLSRGDVLIERGRRGGKDEHWMAAAKALTGALAIFEARAAVDLAEAARARLRAVLAGLEPPAPQLPRAALSA